MTEEVFNKKEDLIDCLTSLALANKWVFRGYNTQDQLCPNVMRKKLTDAERELLFEFERYGAQYINANNPIDFMSYAQHFGLPTRLLDFTYNPFVALYFSLFSPKSNGNYKAPEDRECYYIRYSSVRDNILIKYAPCLNLGSTYEINSMAQRSITLINTVNMMFSNTGKGHILFKTRDEEIKAFFASIAWNTEIEDMDIFISENKDNVYNRTILFIDPRSCSHKGIEDESKIDKG